MHVYRLLLERTSGYLAGRNVGREDGRKAGRKVGKAVLAGGEPEVAKVVYTPLLLDTFRCSLKSKQSHDSRVVHQVLQLET